MQACCPIGSSLLSQMRCSGSYQSSKLQDGALARILVSIFLTRKNWSRSCCVAAGEHLDIVWCSTVEDGLNDLNGTSIG